MTAPPLTQSPTCFTTIIRPHEIPLAEALGADIKRHHPQASFRVLLMPDLGGGAPAHLRQCTLIDRAVLGIPGRLLTAARLTLSGEELRMAIAPLLLAHLAKTEECVVFLAPDTALLHPIRAIPRGYVGILPRLRDLPTDDRSPSAEALAALGPYDGGFLSLCADGPASLSGVGRELWRDSPPRPESINHLWAALPSRVPCTAMSCDGLGIAYWNIHERAGALKGPMLPKVQTLRLPGFLPTRPHLLSADQGPRPRVLISEHPDLRAFLTTHAERLDALGWRGVDDERIGQLVIDASVRSAVAFAIHGCDEVERAACIEAIEAGLLEEWLRACPPGSFDDRVSRYLLGLWTIDEALQLWFPNPRDDQAEAFLAWITQHGPERGVPMVFMPGLARPQSATSSMEVDGSVRPGVNLVGFLRAGFGIGEATRHFARALEEGGVPHAAISVSHQDLEDRVDSPLGEDKPIYDTNLICVNVDWLDMVNRRLGPDFMRSRYTIGTWWWESNVLPERLAQRISEFDELWVGSNFIAESLSAYASIPIRVFPLPIPMPPEEPEPVRSDLGLPSGYLFMFSFDFNSTVERKNPEGVIEAFRAAFGPGEGASLVLKTINGDKHLDELERLRAMARDHADITIVDRFLSGPERDAWARSCDCYVSLHRCEGFGLTMAEAMALGKPVIATGYSANLDFMGPDTAMLVDWEPWVLQHQSGPYPAGTRWAEPDVNQAAHLMRTVFEDPSRGRELGERARKHIRATRRPDALRDFVNGRLEEIRLSGHEVSRNNAAAPLPATLADAVTYNRQRAERTPGVKDRLALKIMRPYSASTDSMLDRLIKSDQWLFQSQRALELRVDALERAALRLADSLATSHELLRRHTERATQEIRDRMEIQRAQLEDLLYPPVFMDNPEAFLTTGEGGQVELGYSPEAPVLADGATGYATFEDIFRGSRERVQAGLEPYVDLLSAHQPVLDVGCGRGEMLLLLEGAGVAAHGVDLDPDMVERAASHGLDVHCADACSYLEELVEAKRAVGSIFSAHVIEHLAWPALQRFLRASYAALKPGGVFIAETPNPHSLQALKAFWLDPTHRHPIFPEALLVFIKQAGFSQASIRFTDGSDLSTSRRVSDSYAVIAVR